VSRQLSVIASTVAAAALAACAGHDVRPATASIAASVNPNIAEPCLTYGVAALQAQAAHLQFVHSAAEEYRLIRAERPADRTLCTFQQINGGVLVQHMEYSVHLGQNGDVLSSGGRYSTSAAAMSSQPKVSEISILEHAHPDAVAVLGSEQPFLAPPQLMFQALTPTLYQLTYELVVSAPGKSPVRLIYNADNGKKLGQQRLSASQ
jgi:Zn-dependent metalloprotease